MGSSARSSRLGPPPGALARQAQGVEQRRELAAALHAPPRPRTRRITERLETLRLEMARYREQAIAVHAKLVALESSSSVEAGPLRRTLIDSSVALEDIVRAMIDTPYPPRRK